MISEIYSRAVIQEMTRAISGLEPDAALVFLGALVAWRAAGLRLRDAVQGADRTLKKLALSRYDDAEMSRLRSLRGKIVRFADEVVAVDDWAAADVRVSDDARRSLSSAAAFVSRAKGINEQALTARAITILRHVPLAAGRGLRLEDGHIQAVAGWVFGCVPRVTQTLIAILDERDGRSIELQELVERGRFTAPAFAYAARRLQRAGLANVRTVRRGSMAVTLIAFTAPARQLIIESRFAPPSVTLRNEIKREQVDEELVV